MIEFRTLGGIRLVGHEGNELHSILARPKLLGLLAYLAVARPRGFHRRDTLMGLFWPDSDQDRARRSLRQALYHLRQSLGHQAITVRGDDEVALCEDGFWCDAWSGEGGSAEAEVEDFLDHYQGEFLQGFYLSDLWDFESWVDRTRSELRSRAARAAMERAERQRGDAGESTRWAWRALETAPLDEGLLRRGISALERAGDRAGALRAHRDFSRRMARELGAEPAQETRALVACIRRNGGEPEVCEAPPPPDSSSQTVPVGVLLLDVGRIKELFLQALQTDTLEAAHPRRTPCSPSCRTSGSPYAP